MRSPGKSKALLTTVASAAVASHNESRNEERMPQPGRKLLLSAALISAAVSGWLASSSLASIRAQMHSSIDSDPQISELLHQMRSGELPGQDQQWLLGHLLVLGRLEEAQRVLAPLLKQHPHQISLTLLMADLHRRTGSPERAMNDLDQVLALHPNHPEAMQMRVLVELQRGRISEARSWLQQTFQALPVAQRTSVGLLMADLELQQGHHDRATALYRQLAGESKGDARPVLALAMLRGEQGRTDDMQVLLHEARLRRGPEAVKDPLIDTVGAHWGLQAQRQRPAG